MRARNAKLPDAFAIEQLIQVHVGDGTLLPGMQQRIERAMSGERLPGHYPLGQAPVGLWEVPPGS